MFSTCKYQLDYANFLQGLAYFTSLVLTVQLGHSATGTMPSTSTSPPKEVVRRSTAKLSQSSQPPAKISPDISQLLQTQVKSPPVSTVSPVKEEPPSLHIWDFAGHELYYTTHQVSNTFLN